jgi:hypothetical protein
MVPVQRWTSIQILRVFGLRILSGIASQRGPRKAWLKLRQSKEVVEQIMTALARQKQSAKWREGFVVSPERYILEERWEDFIDMEPARPGPKQAERVECDHVPPCANIHWHMVVAARERGEV